MSEVRILASGLGFPEGPVACDDGSVVLTEIRTNRVTRVTADGKVSTLSATGGGPNGLAVGPDGAGSEVCLRNTRLDKISQKSLP